MRTAGLILLVIILLLSLCTCQICPSDLPTHVDAILTQSEWRHTTWGILIEYLNSSSQWEVLYSLNADKYFSPASNNKLLTTSAMFTLLGPSYQYSTPLYMSSISSGTSVCLAARGDPSLTGSSLQEIASFLVSKGITQLEGLQVDDSFFAGYWAPLDWEWGDMWEDYGAQPASFMLNENVVSFSLVPGAQVGQPASVQFFAASDAAAIDVTNTAVTGPANSTNTATVSWKLTRPGIFVEGSVPLGAAPTWMDAAVPNTTDYLLRSLRFVLNASKIDVRSVSVGPCPGSWQEVFAVKSQPLSVLMNHTLQVSDNMYAEAFQRTLGTLFVNVSGITDSAQYSGVAVIANQLVRAGRLDPDSFHQDDGSGLSRQNLVTPNAIADVLEWMYSLPNGSLYRSFLPVAGESGTLANRFVGTPAQGIVHAKTGTMTGISALSGYMLHTEFPPVIFSIINNLSEQSTSARQAGIDSIVLLLPQLKLC